MSKIVQFKKENLRYQYNVEPTYLWKTESNTLNIYKFIKMYDDDINYVDTKHNLILALKKFKNLTIDNLGNINLTNHTTQSD